jgi:glycosyltransferase involved in cell wall biosynthesis
MRFGFYDPYLATLGGGEKYLLSIVEVAAKLPGAELAIFSPTRPDPRDWRRLNIELAPDAFTWAPAPRDAAASRLSADVEVFVAMHNTLPPRSLARRSLAVVQFPFRRPTHLLDPLRRRADRRRLGSYDAIVCYSQFVSEHVSRRLGVDACVIPPPVDLPLAGEGPKQPQILAVGRFFRGGHNKRHETLIRAFRLLTERSSEAGWRLHLAGGAHDDRSARTYLDGLREQAAGLPVEFHVNVPAAELAELYRGSALFWHAAGEGEDPDRHPERLEHFGITTVEAMAHGCVPVVIGLGGQPEIVSDGEDGHLWRTVDELVEISAALIADPDRRAAMARRARETAGRFSRERFEERVWKLLEPGAQIARA